MEYISRIKEILKEQNGTLLSLELDKEKIPRTYLSMMVAEGDVERVGRGSYVSADSIEDMMYILQQKYPNIVYSHETALFFHDLTNRTPIKYSVTVPSGYKVVKALSDKSKIYYIKKDLHQMGTVERATSFGNPVKVYNIERTICDILRSRNRIDPQILTDALKMVVQLKKLNYPLLSEYAKKLKVDKILSMYLEVLI